MSRKLFLGLSKYVLLAIVFAGLVVLLIPVSSVKADSVVTFPDPNLEAAIRQAINKPTGDIYQSDLVGLTSLAAESDNITNLTGLEHCTSLTTLDLDNNQTSDISSLSGLTSLTFLLLENNGIGDISPLSGLTNLDTLDLDNNQISHLSPLSGLTGLRQLDLDGNQISHLSPLSGLTGLTNLQVWDNQISDISPLSGLTSLQFLGLDINQISDISPLSGLTNLMSVLLGNTQISDISPLSGLTNLKTLDLSNNQISDISPLSGLTSLSWLWLDNTQIADLSPLSGLTNLTVLLLDNNQISDIGPLAGNTGLGTGDYVYLSSNPLSPTSINDYIPQLQAKGVTVYYSSTASAPTIASLPPPNNHPIYPSSGVQGQTLTVSITGNYFTGATSVSFGSGITVNNFTEVTDLLMSNVIEATTDMIARITISGSATPGTRDVSVTTPGGTATETGGFTVKEASNQPPYQPSNVSPANGATGSSMTPTLQSSAFSDPDAGDTHAASQWQITTTSGDYLTPTLGVTSTTSLTEFTVPSGTLDYGVTYYWHVKYEDNHGNCSDWSNETSFTTAAAQVETATSTGTAGFTPDTGTIESLQAVSQSTLPALPPEVTQSNLKFPDGFFSFNITGLTDGDNVTLTITLPTAVPDDAQYWKYLPTSGEWQEIPWTRISSNTISITLKDGGLGDDDQSANGTIVDPGGLGDPPTPSGGGAHSAPVFPNIYVGIGAALGAGIVAYFVRRRLIAQKHG